MLQRRVKDEELSCSSSSWCVQVPVLWHYCEMKQSSVTHLSRSAASLTLPLVSALWTVSVLSPGFGLDPPPPEQNKGTEASQRGVEGHRSALQGPTASLCWTAVQSHTTLLRHRWDIREQLRCIRWNKLMESITSQTSDQLIKPVRVCCLLLAVCCHYNKQLSEQLRSQHRHRSLTLETSTYPLKM